MIDETKQRDGVAEAASDETSGGRVEASMTLPPGADILGAGDGEVISAFATLPPGTLLSRKGVAKILRRHEKAVERGIDRGELPPPSLRMAGRDFWQAGAIQAHIEARIQEATADRERLANCRRR